MISTENKVMVGPVNKYINQIIFIHINFVLYIYFLFFGANFI